MIAIDPIQFLIQAAALAAWVIFAAVVYSVIERALSDVDDRSTAMITAYALWLFMGLVGAHRIFTKRIPSGLAQLVLTFILFLLSLAFGYPYLFAIPAVLWWLYDLTQIGGWVKTMDLTPAPEQAT
jgi:TM2 domain-containing membrane protein YozV